MNLYSVPGVGINLYSVPGEDEEPGFEPLLYDLGSPQLSESL